MTVSLVQNFFKQTVTTPWTVGTGNFYVSQKPNVTSGFLVISPNSESLREIVSFSAVGTDGGGDYVTVSARGLGGTTEQAHGAGERVYMNITAQHIEQIKQAIDDINNSGALNASTTVKGVARLSVAPNTTVGTPTITIATPAVVTLTTHGLTENDEIQFNTDGNLPTGITPAATYYVIGTGLTANEFQFSATFGGPAVNTSGSQSGTHTLTRVTPRAVSENDVRIPTANQSAAMVGNTTPPSASNPFLTQNNFFTSNDQSQLTQNVDIEVGEANATTKKNQVHQSFIPTQKTIRGVKLYKRANLGTFTGTVTIALKSDNSGNPDTTLASIVISNANWNNITVGEFTAYFSTEYTSLVIGNTYWISVSTSTADNSNRITLGGNSAGGYANGLLKYQNVTDGYVTLTGVDLYFTTLNGIVNTTSKFNIDVFTKDGIWVKPVGAKFVLVRAWAGGGAGGRHDTEAGGGGGGVYREMFIPADNITTDIFVKIGIGGIGSSVLNTVGAQGGDTSFGSFLTAFGGGGGGVSGSVNGGGGGAGGSYEGKGPNGTATLGGVPVTTKYTGLLSTSFFGYGMDSDGTLAAGSTHGIFSGGGGSGFGNASLCFAGDSEYGGAGGGGTGTLTAGGVSKISGNGGAANGAGAARNGVFPSGGGGGCTSGTSGNGADGAAVIITYF